MFPPEYHDTEDPPEYEIRELRSKESLDPSTWYSQGSIVSGTIVISPLKTMKFSGLTLTLNLNEIMHRFVDSVSGGYRLKRSTVLGVYRIPRDLWPENGIFLAGNQYSFEFDLQFPLVYLQSVANSRIPLPPTLGAQSETAESFNSLDIKDCSARILYSIESQLIKSDSDIPIKAIRYVRFSPFNTFGFFEHHLPQLNLDKQTFHSEHKLIQGRFSHKSDGKLYITANMLKIPMFMGSNASIQIQFQANLSRQEANIPDLKRIAVILDIYTLSTTEPWKSLPTIENMNRNDHICIESRQLSKRDNHKLTWNIKSKDIYESEIMIPVTIDQNIKNLPSFISSTIFRHYKLRIHGEFHKHRSIEFIIPIWLERDQCISSLSSIYSNSTFSSISGSSNSSGY